MLRPLLAAAALAVVLVRPAAAVDLHRLWDERCSRCHEHSADFARSKLRLVDGRLTGSEPDRDLAEFLGEHRGGLPPALAAGLTAMLTAEAASPNLFRLHCRICHGTAAELARTALIRRDDALYGRYSGRSIAEFLKGHGRLDADGAAFFLDLLERLEAEVHFEGE